MLLVCMSAALCGFTVQPLTAAQQALVNHRTNNDPNWIVLSHTVVAEDAVRGVLNASFDPGLRDLAGRPFTISGYMTPLEDNPLTRHFIITRRDPTCPFCPPNAPTEAIEVRTRTPTVFTHEEVAVSGRLKLVASSDQGLFFQLEDAAIASAHG